MISAQCWALNINYSIAFAQCWAPYAQNSKSSPQHLQRSTQHSRLTIQCLMLSAEHLLLTMQCSMFITRSSVLSTPKTSLWSWANISTLSLSQKLNMELAAIVAQSRSLRYIEHDWFYWRSWDEIRSREASDSMWACIGNQLNAMTAFNLQHWENNTELWVLSSDYWAMSTK